ncbi:hypothetical protein [Hymenobacter sp. 5414T-23]|uniref:hypothetical protein n=1 Tax=Hymenobacter sp. 5414T-23 TaxID=2932252 RepID=UPI001FD201EE|nr:hypothetical protein [Hymenobacter sp. 5414T-23]UOQ83292.1 hypothetical protein MUN83_20970 [Hymenobacter sp. 5414T-23]
MSSPAPRPAASTQNAGFIMILLLLAIIGGDYYVLMHGSELAKARRVQLVQAAEAPAESLTPKQRLAATTARIAERQRQARIAKAAAAAAR